ncbi:hypothetical protein MD484_g4116, partial [Candolleomyces efflorescens]
MAPDPSNGRIFASHKGLKSHQKLHDQQEVEDELRSSLRLGINEDEPPFKKPRRGGDIGRDWKCDAEGCNKDFKSQKKALTTHKNVNHLGKRDFVCSQCDKSFGYRHLLQRHAAKIHGQPSLDDSDAGDQADEEEEGFDPDLKPFAEDHIDQITGKAYADRTIGKAGRWKCPFPDLNGLVCETVAAASSQFHCDYSFSRLYDLRRHLKAGHQVSTDKDALQEIRPQKHLCIDQHVVL